MSSKEYSLKMGKKADWCFIFGAFLVFIGVVGSSSTLTMLGIFFLLLNSKVIETV